MKSNVSNLVRDALMLGILVCLSQISVTLPTAVPITLQTLAIYLIACLLTPTHAFYTVLCYLIMGAVGLPVRSNRRILIQFSYYGISDEYYYYS